MNQDCSNIDFSLIQDPFFQKTTNIKSDFSLQAIISNKVKINDKWYALNDDIEGFKIVEIKNSQVVLIKEEKIMVLKLYEKNNIFIY
ncbi:hypothetical protein L8U98_01290 [Campylobacter sp. RKI_CA19_01128]|uniref:Transformation system protein n=1 Tax=Campylobacter lari TaxID=201 RepID=A0A7M1MHY7_CAMLA|nr:MULTISPECIES: hypothetical protein [unclassified Campylobacter]EAK0436840.1 hypothetical protein [Campylobacter lari]MCV3354491.1 hypothetical protein [Campylobacter sp. RKI_CA19_01128]MCV3387662.1 hypothetical protein [Campylobacter sp. IFREMER_LSEM_CL2256]MCV3470611.1 hypothetical protein [Campylobacter sp. CNRCH_2015_0814]MCV3482799.1 hypothetical protein [Campylobacter sp. CNRCH_2014_0184h]